MTEEDKRRLALIYSFNGITAKDMALTTFYRVAEELGYRPWKELALYDKDKGFTKENMYFTYATSPTKKQLGLNKDCQREVVDSQSEHIYMIRLLGRLLMSYDKVSDNILEYFDKLSSEYDKEVLQTVLGYIGGIQRNTANCLALLDDLVVNEEFIAPKKKLSEGRGGSFKLETTRPEEFENMCLDFEVALPDYLQDSASQNIE